MTKESNESRKELAKGGGGRRDEELAFGRG
jgi:hypothetical protein